MNTPRRLGSSTRTLLCVALASAAVASVSIAMDPPTTQKDAGAAHTARGGGQDATRPRGPGAAAQVSVEGAMKIMARAQRTLKDQIGDASKREENIKLVIDMQRGCVLAKGQELPADIIKGRPLDKPKTDAEVQAMRDTFAKGLRELLRELVELEQAIVDAKLDEAAKHFARVGELENQTHEALGMKE